jgi:hypothetical protein
MTDLDDADQDIVEQEKWGLGREGMAVRKILRVLRRDEQDLVQAREAIQNLRERVKALEDASP